MVGLNPKNKYSPKRHLIKSTTQGHLILRLQLVALIQPKLLIQAQTKSKAIKALPSSHSFCGAS